MGPQCFCLFPEREPAPYYENLDQMGSPGSHKKAYGCGKCSGTLSESIDRHNFKKDLEWYCICGAKDPKRG